MLLSMIALLAFFPGPMSPEPAAAQEPIQSVSAPAPQHPAPGVIPDLKFDLSADGVVPVLAIGTAVGLSNGLQSPVLGCKWCDTSSSGALSLNGLDRFCARARWRDSEEKYGWCLSWQRQAKGHLTSFSAGPPLCYD